MHCSPAGKLNGGGESPPPSATSNQSTLTSNEPETSNVSFSNIVQIDGGDSVISDEYGDKISDDDSEYTTDDEIDPSLSASIEKDSSGASIESKLLGLPSAASYITKAVSEEGVSETATAILANTELKDKILELLLIEAHQEFKCSLRKSILKKTQERTYLLTLTPQVLCEEFANNAPMCFQLLVKGILGKDIDTVLRSQKLQNIVSLLYSTGSKYVNRKAIGFALQLTTTARDGGLREDSLNILSCCVHPRTSQV